MRALVVALALALVAAAIGLLWLLRAPAPLHAGIAATPLSITGSGASDAQRRAESIDAATSPARVERETLLANLARSGIGDEVWNARAGALFAAIAKPPVTAAIAGCYIAGCGATFTFASEAAYQRTLAGLSEIPEYRAWTGGKNLTNPETRSDGSVLVGLVLYRPD